MIQVTRPWVWAVLAGVTLVIIAAVGWAVAGTVTDTVEVQGVLLRKEGVKPLKPLLGADEKRATVRRLAVVSGQRVHTGDLLAELEVGGAVRRVLCPIDDAVILRRVASEGAEVGTDDALLLYEHRNEPLQALLYPPTTSGYRIEPGMSVRVTPANAKQVESGYLIGKVVSASKYPITPAELAARFQNEELVRQFLADGPRLQVLVELDGDPDSASGTKWSVGAGRNTPLFSGLPCQARVIIREFPPINLVFPGLLPAKRDH
ncbi:MAG: hypothetical protein K2P78_00300 [Gemmataceae bacterium]|nr:hypothetical protein [Gemmataceae bacterium]